MDVLRTSRTSRPKASRVSIVAKVVRELVRERRFTSYADLFDVLKGRLAKYRLTATHEDVNGALRLIESNTRVVQKRLTPARAPEPPMRELSATEAAQALAQIVTKLKEKYPEAPAVHIKGMR